MCANQDAGHDTGGSSGGTIDTSPLDSQRSTSSGDDFTLTWGMVLSVMPSWLSSNISKLKPLLTEGPRKWATAIVIGVIWGMFIQPIVGGFLAAGATLIDPVIWVFLGSDGELGLSPDSTLGLADIPLALEDALLGSGTLGLLFRPVFQFLDAYQGVLATVAAEAGPIGPAIVIAGWTLLVLILGQIAWWIIRSVDVPFINLGPILKGLSAPFRKLYAWTQGGDDS
jgi:hypothetical protein